MKRIRLECDAKIERNTNFWKQKIINRGTRGGMMVMMAAELRARRIGEDYVGKGILCRRCLDVTDETYYNSVMNN